MQTERYLFIFIHKNDINKLKYYECMKKLFIYIHRKSLN